MSCYERYRYDMIWSNINVEYCHDYKEIKSADSSVYIYISVAFSHSLWLRASTIFYRTFYFGYACSVFQIEDSMNHRGLEVNSKTTPHSTWTHNFNTAKRLRNYCTNSTTYLHIRTSYVVRRRLAIYTVIPSNTIQALHIAIITSILILEISGT